MKTPFAYLRNLVIGLIFTGILVLTTQNTVATSYPDVNLHYDSSTNSFELVLDPDEDGQVALYYKNTEGNINAVFGEDSNSLPAKTCSDSCVEDDVEYGVIKIAIPSLQLRKSIWFKLVGNQPKIVYEVVTENINSDGSTASNNSILQMNSAEELWLNEPVDFTPTPSATPTIAPSVTSSPTNTLIPTATLTPSPTPAIPVAAGTCTVGSGWLSQTIFASQGKQNNGLSVPLYRSSPTYAFGSSDSVYFALGKAGIAAYKFSGNVQNIPGPDITVYEETIGRATYPIEQAKVEVSLNGLQWYTLPKMASSRGSALGTTSLDFSSTGLSTIRYIRITDIPNPSNTYPEADGFDLNAIEAISQYCSGAPTSTVTPTLTPSSNPTNTPTTTPSSTPTSSPTITPTNTVTPSPTHTPTITPSSTPTNTPTITPSPTVTNLPPVVNAGTDSEVTLPETTVLAGSANDDGLPNPPATLFTSWVKVSGPGEVLFIVPDPLTPTVQFSLPGIYILQLSATDSEHEIADQVTITVNPAPTATVTPTNTPTITLTPSPVVIPPITRISNFCFIGCSVGLRVAGTNLEIPTKVRAVHPTDSTKSKTIQGAVVSGNDTKTILNFGFSQLDGSTSYALEFTFVGNYILTIPNAFNTNP